MRMASLGGEKERERTFEEKLSRALISKSGL